MNFVVWAGGGVRIQSGQSRIESVQRLTYAAIMRSVVRRVGDKRVGKRVRRAACDRALRDDAESGQVGIAVIPDRQLLGGLAAGAIEVGTGDA